MARTRITRAGRPGVVGTGAYHVYGTIEVLILEADACDKAARRLAFQIRARCPKRARSDTRSKTQTGDQQPQTLETEITRRERRERHDEGNDRFQHTRCS